MDGIRAAESRDIPELRALWQICFGDEKAWEDWFFSSRLNLDGSYVFIKDGKVVGDLYVYPYVQYIRGKKIPADCLHGVATHPEYQGQGIMSQLLKHQMRNSKGTLLFHTPVKFDQYFKFGHLVTALAGNYEIEGVGENSAYQIAEEFMDLTSCYDAFAKRFSLMVARDQALWKLRYDDLMVSGAKLLVLEDQSGYAFFYEKKDKIIAVELCYQNRDELLSALSHYAAGRKLVCTLPEADADGFKQEKLSHSVSRIYDVEELLRWLEFDFTIGIQVVDPIISKNNRLFGEKADITLEVGAMGEWLLGFKSIYEIEKLKVPNESVLKRLDEAFPKVDCYIFEKY